MTKWIRGEYRTKSEARAELGSSTIISDDDWYDYIKLIARFWSAAAIRACWCSSTNS
ncbi:MAG: BREX system ATP-binding domain-containing protein [Collinsella sp.]